MEGIVFIQDPAYLGSGRFEEDGYFFLVCKKGNLSFSILDSPRRFGPGDGLILKNKQDCFRFLSVSEDFSMEGVFASNPFLVRTGVGRYASDAKRKASIFFNPVIPMSEGKSLAVIRSFENLRARMESRCTYHYEEAVLLAFQCLVLDFSEGQIEGYLAQKAPDVNAELFGRFIQLLEQGHAKQHRNVSWYADNLCITPKHLSFCTKLAGGRTAAYWIDSYCIRSLVKDLVTRPASEIWEEYRFSSLSYLCRYVKRLTGLPPRQIH